MAVTFSLPGWLPQKRPWRKHRACLPLKVIVLPTLLGCLLTHAQSGCKVLFTNHDLSHGVDAPVYDDDWATRLSSPYVAQLCQGPSPDGLIASGLPTPFKAEPNAGYWEPVVVPVVAALPGAMVFVKARVWSTGDGPTYEEALAAGGKVGESSTCSIACPSGTFPSQIVVRWESFCVRRGGSICAITVDPPGHYHGSDEQMGAFSVDAPASCAWSAVSPNNWISFPLGNSGTGSRTLYYLVGSNESMTERAGNIWVGAFDGLAYDDDNADWAGRLPGAGDGVAVRFSPMVHPYFLQFVSVKIANLPAVPSEPTQRLLLRVYGESNGAPGDLLADGIEVASDPIPEHDSAWVYADVSQLGIVLKEGGFFVEAVWLVVGSPAIGVDTSPPNEGRTWVHENGSWELLASRYPEYATWQAMIRASGTTNAPPAGFTIVQAPQLRLGTPVVASPGSVQFSVAGPPETRVVIEASNDLVQWTAISTNILTNGRIECRETIGAGSARRFYRAAMPESVQGKQREDRGLDYRMPSPAHAGRNRVPLILSGLAEGEGPAPFTRRP